MSESATRSRMGPAMTEGGSPIIVQKYGGSSVATPEHIARVADQVVHRQRSGCRLVVVVSAMGRATDELLQMARRVSTSPDRRELDMLLTVGERISMALLALAIRDRGLEAVSLTGSQSGILTTASHTSARVMEVRPFRIQDELERGRVVIVAGYQGVSYQREITTLGRGGSDTTAVALAAALDAEACEIYSDVDGVWTADPRLVDDARRIDALDFKEMEAMARSGARVLHARAVEYARTHGIALYARQTGLEGGGTVIRRDTPPEEPKVRAVTHRPRVLRADLSNPGADDVLRGLIRAGARVDQAVRWPSALHVLLDPTDFAGTPGAWPSGVEIERFGCVTVVGGGSGDLTVADQAAAALRDQQIEVESSWIDPRCAHLVVERGDVPEAVRRLHRTFELGDPPESSLAPVAPPRDT